MLRLKVRHRRPVPRRPTYARRCTSPHLPSPDRRLGVLALYEGNAPWTGAQLKYATPGGTNAMFWPSERWAAYLDPATGYGIGVFVPIAERLTAYRVGADNSTRVSDTSYFAPLAKFAIQPNSTFSYKVGREGWLRVALGLMG